MNLEYVLQIAAPSVCTVIVGFTGWSLKRNVADLDEKLTSIATDLRQLSSQVSTHSASLAAGAEKFQSMERALRGLEDRERERGCFSRCAAQLPKTG